MRIILSFSLILILCVGGSAQLKPPHYITGGQVFYTYQGMRNEEHVYRVTFQCYRSCPGGQVSVAIVSIYDRVTNALIKKVEVPISNVSEMKQTGDPLNNCIANPPSKCIVEATYATEISLPSSVNGYTIACIPKPVGDDKPVHREEGIINLSEWGYVLATYTAEIPGGTAATNSTFLISGDELNVNCENSGFSFNFGAFDTDGDELRYYLCDAYRAGLNVDNYIYHGAPPPFQPVVYANNFSGSNPLGPNVTVDEKLGILKGIAPGEGTYLVCVCVGEYRNGVLIATQRREFQINITSCKVAKASLLPEYLLCKDNSTLQLSNLSSGFRVEGYNWQITNSDGTILHTDTKPNVSYTFKDTGVYNIKLVINKGVNECVDSVTSIAKVYPGLKPDFIFSGDCIGKPTSFTNTSTATLGQINYWKWDFGDGLWGNAAYGRPDVTGEFSPTYQYQNYGPRTVQLVVGTTYGCRDTLRRTINITPKPALNMVYKERLICLGDTTELWAHAPGGGNFSWTPSNDMINSNTDRPKVAPAVTTVYHVLLDNNGCQNRDSVKVRLIDKVFVQAMNDTTICQGDSIQLKLASDALTYSWTNVPPAKATQARPIVITNTTTDYEVTASTGGCSAKDTVRVITVPYPTVNAGADIMICEQESAQLRGTSNGSTITWSPASTLSGADIPDPVAQPAQTTSYVLTAVDTRGCPKPAYDTVVINVLPPIKPFAGRDTTALIGLPLQLNASGGAAYEWSPATGLSATNIRNPIANYTAPSEGIEYKVRITNEAGCADSAYITVKVLASKPQIFVPNAFTPNQDGRNDILRPIAIGMQRIEYFNIYNRWGQLVFSTQRGGQGWNGTVGGQLQSTDVFTWAVKAVDIDGKPYFQKGTVTLIR